MLYWLLDTMQGTLRYISVRATFAVLTALVLVLWGAAAGRLAHRMGQLVGPDVSAFRLVAMIGAAARGDLMQLSAVFIAALVWVNPFIPNAWIVLGTAVGFGLIGLRQDYQSTIDRSASGRDPFGSKP